VVSCKKKKKALVERSHMDSSETKWGPSPLPLFSLFSPSFKVGEKGTIICLNPQGMIAE
jgi:hypothetical protein